MMPTDTTQQAGPTEGELQRWEGLSADVCMACGLFRDSAHGWNGTTGGIGLLTSNDGGHYFVPATVDWADLHSIIHALTETRGALRSREEECERLRSALRELLAVSEPGDVWGHYLNRYERATDAAAQALGAT